MTEGYILQEESLIGSLSEFEEITGEFDVNEPGIVGEFEDENTLIGYISQEEPLIGTVSVAEEIVGEFGLNESGLIGEMTYGSGSERIPEYLGPYLATPTLEAQIFETKNKKLLDNFTVDATPISDVRTVDTDGYTITVL